MSPIGRVIPLPRRKCPRGGEVAVEQRWDQQHWFVTCDVCGTLEANVPIADARHRAAAHLEGTDGDGGLLVDEGERPPGGGRP